MNIIDQLMSFSLTRQEAMIYITLYSEGTLTGYEVAKLSGISRSNSYTALASLVEKGAANIIEDTATRYVPVDIDEFCENKIRTLTKIQKKLNANMPKVKEETEGYITIKGVNHIFDKAINLVSNAKERIYISIGEEYLDKLKPYLQEAVNKNLKVVVISNPSFKLKGAILYFSKQPLNQMRLIVDSSAVLTGDIIEDGTCLYSKNKNLVDLFKQTLKNEIKLIELKEI